MLLVHTADYFKEIDVLRLDPDVQQCYRNTNEIKSNKVLISC